MALVPKRRLIIKSILVHFVMKAVTSVGRDGLCWIFPAYSYFYSIDISNE